MSFRAAPAKRGIQSAVPRRASSALVYLVALAALFTAAPLHAQPPASIQDLAHPQGTNAGIFAFTGRCATCHDAGKGGATDRYALNRHTPEEVLASITPGSMAQYAQGLTEYEKRVGAVYVGGRPLAYALERDAAG
jgi:mono/diheme cytochrome c family protein